MYLNTDTKQHHVTVKQPIDTESPIGAQLSMLGFTPDKHTITLSVLKSTMSNIKSEEYVATNFEGDDNPGNILAALLEMGDFRPVTLQEIYQSKKFVETIYNVQRKNWNLSSIANRHGETTLHAVITSGIKVKIGLFPQDIDRNITPDHHLYPRNAELYKTYPVIQLKKDQTLEWMNTTNFDVLWEISTETHLFKDTLEGELMNAKKSEQKYARGEPGCWYIEKSKFMQAARLKATVPLTPKIVLEVRKFFSYLRSYIIITNILRTSSNYTCHWLPLTKYCLSLWHLLRRRGLSGNHLNITKTYFKMTMLIDSSD